MIDPNLFSIDSGDVVASYLSAERPIHRRYRRHDGREVIVESASGGKIRYRDASDPNGEMLIVRASVFAAKYRRI